MTTLSALTRNYFSRVNIPFDSNNTSQILIESFYTWGLYACLTNQITIGSQTGTRDPNSVWFVRGSSNTTGSAVSAVGVAGTDRWGGATFPGVFTRGNNGTPHHWMLLENSYLGQEMLINFAGFGNVNYHVSVAPTGTFSGGGDAQHPTPSAGSSVVIINQTAYEGENGGMSGFFVDTANTGFVNYLHFTCASTGEFWFAMSRTGANSIYNFISLWKTINQQSIDDKNIFLLSTDVYNGVPDAGRIQTNGFCASRQPSGAQKTYGGIVNKMVNGGGYMVQAIAGLGVDAINGKYNSIPAEVIEISPQYLYRGYFPDIYVVGGAAVGSSIPSTITQERIIVGNLILPCTGSTLII